MTAIRKFVNVENSQLHITLPSEFNNKEVEVVILPKNNEDDLSIYNELIEEGLNSPKSEKKHKEIFSNLKKLYAQN